MQCKNHVTIFPMKDVLNIALNAVLVLVALPEALRG